MASLSLVLRYIIVLTFFLILDSKEIFSSRLVRSSKANVAQISADDYPSSGRNSPVHDLGFPDFPSFQEPIVTPQPDLPLLPRPPTFPDLEKGRFPVPVWHSLPDFPPLPFLDQPPPSEPFGPRFDESDNWLPSVPSIPQGFP
ncbi:unnamed protein product [Brassica oleracea var. botrytis]|uniref:Uncharacterized protein n=3 Tax=Brassica TaxID=3705 RepID=A0A0D3CF03_BRAOL|nr:hypothetical protein Bca52824_064569 [Brassica carinata]CAF1928926.1 unnamed protein product [Brassica napus]CDY09542.1 BnaC05g23770D [Brassica napus]